ncbi:23S rRNA (uracil(1939)-C(5))-methyltransferase RlmD [Parashewanella curva]|uniref:23S rRNA (uracil(1939)-C(5))-methyltransferase RlmD n=1 Tax=Parashewanella curva TaxID=2338552 RepID=A0A3L8PYN0_9GAMM|nr:23S rRNA (uracil(1939)-C(5))-methyltransferase RlmD [Parashewanella curva]RLV59588.1 23S rRNA (uracil(1939)-C(5))-methyltransferase RlmD [Parashewanella curva]
MAQFFTNKPKRSKKMSPRMTLTMNQLDHLGAGVAHHQGKVVFTPKALSGETVELQLVEQKKKFAKGKLIKVLVPSPDRVVPDCQYYEECGGCDLQHLDVDAQRQHKLNTLSQLMEKLAKVTPPKPEMISGEAWRYRRRAKLATSFGKASNRLNVGFRKSASRDVIDIESCKVLPETLDRLIKPLADTLNQLKGVKRLGHIELIQGDKLAFVVIRTPEALSSSDKNVLKEFALEHDLNMILQLNDNQFESIHGDELLPSYQVANSRLQFSPGSFVQVNASINEKMVAQALEWLQPQSGERILDLFCGMGNFSLPLAQSGAHVIGVEGVKSAVKQAQFNASINRLKNVEFYDCDLSADLSAESWLGKIDKLLLDPARAGAFECLQWLKKLSPNQVLYVSCDPSSLSRDTKVLLDHGYQLQKLAMIDMFPQTHHIEAMALFSKK